MMKKIFDVKDSEGARYHVAADDAQEALNLVKDYLEMDIVSENLPLVDLKMVQELPSWIVIRDEDTGTDIPFSEWSKNHEKGIVGSTEF